MPTRSTLASLALVCTCLACAGETDAAPDSKPREAAPRTQRPMTQPAVEVPETASAVEGPPSAGGVPRTTPRPDRCLVDSCGDTSLLPQPELGFLEDMGDGWQRLMELDWEVGPGAEGYRCMTLTVPEDIYIAAFAPQTPFGTHHVTFGVSSHPVGPDEIKTCGVGVLGERNLEAGGPGTKPTSLPAGVAMPLTRGTQLYMNLHLFNVGDETLRGRSGMWVRTMRKGDVEQMAENVAAGPLQLDIPRGRSTQHGICTLRAAATLHAVSPHMHQTGVHMRGTALTARGEMLLYDGDYDFYEQEIYDVGSVELQAGDRVHVECTYENVTDRPLHWGDSALDEMCFLGLVLYPSINYGADPCSS